MISPSPALYSHVLQSLSDGVLTIRGDGQILTFNPAAGELLGWAPEDVVGKSLGATLLMDPELDAFSELVLKAVYEKDLSHRAQITLAVGGTRRDLAVSSSALRGTSDGDVGQPGGGAINGVVVVLSDVTEERKRRKLKQLFSEYLDPRIVARIVDRGAEEVTRQRAHMTISFVDLRDFTGWSDRLPADRLIDMLNAYLAAMTAPVIETGGYVDKFVGDAVMACWGAPFSDPDAQAAAACEAALRQMEALPRLRAELSAEAIAGAERVDAVVGIATGEVVSGDVGTATSRNFTVIGRTVNKAARLQEAAKVLEARIVVAEETALAAGGGFTFEPLRRVKIRGLEGMPRVYALTGRRDGPGTIAVPVAAARTEEPAGVAAPVAAPSADDPAGG